MSAEPLGMPPPFGLADGPPEPPHNVEAEQALIGAVLVNNGALDRLSDPLRPEEFYLPAHGRIWGATLALIERGSIANPVTLRLAFEADQALADVGGSAYLARLAGAAVAVVQVEHYAALVRDLAVRRDLLSAGRDIAEQAGADDATPAVELVADAERRLSDIGGISMARGAAPLAGTTEALLRALREPASVEPPLLTGIRAIDDRIRLAPGRYVVVAGRTSMGKSALALDMAYRVTAEADRRGQRVGAVFFSLEMSAEDCGARLLSNVSWSRNAPITYEAILRGQVNERDMACLDEAAVESARLPFWIDDRAGLSPGQVSMAARRAKRYMAREGVALRLVVVDHITKMRPDRDRRDGSKVAEVGEISGALARLAKELGVCVVACCQINRGTEQRDDKRPGLADLRWSGDIEQDADTVAALYREEYYLQRQPDEVDPAKAMDQADRRHRARNLCELITLKNRGGSTGTDKLFCDISCNKFTDMEYR